MSERILYSPLEAGPIQEKASLIDNFTNSPAELQEAVCRKAIEIMSHSFSSSIRSNINY